MARPANLLFIIAASLSAACAHAPRTSSSLPFDLRGGFWSSVHEQLLAEVQHARRAHDAGPRPPDGDPRWQAALKLYEARFSSEPPFSAAIFRVGWLLSNEGDGSLLTGVPLDAELRAALEGAGDAYRSQWPAQRVANEEWIANARRLVDRHGARMVSRLERIYGQRWPGPLRVEVAARGGVFGAYTTGEDTRTLTTVSAWDPGYAGDATLEMLFHEGSHAIADALQEKLEAEAARQRRELDPTAWHAVLFFVAGEVARGELGPGYVPYADANHVWDHGWGSLKPLVESAFRPVVEGHQSMDEGIRALVAQLPAAR